MQLFCVKPKASENEAYYVVAVGYGAAVMKYKERVAEIDPELPDSQNTFDKAVDRVPNPEKVTLVCDKEHFIP